MITQSSDLSNGQKRVGYRLAVSADDKPSILEVKPALTTGWFDTDE